MMIFLGHNDNELWIPVLIQELAGLHYPNKFQLTPLKEARKGGIASQQKEERKLAQKPQ